MRQWIKGLAVFIISAALPVAFTNCDSYSENKLFDSYSKACAGDEECADFNSQYLEVRINSDHDIPVDPLELDLNIGGDCNDAGFPDNEIIWELFLDGEMVSNSRVEQQYNRCENGRFSLYVVLPIAGLKDVGGVRREHQLSVEIIGLSKDGSEVYRNPLVGRKEVNLVPAQ